MWLLLACSGPEVDSGRPPKPEFDDTGDSAADSGDGGETGDTGETDETGETGETGDTGEPVHDPLPICVNELMPDNEAALLADDGTTPDWIELHNPGDEAVALDGWSLTDAADDPRRGVLSGGLVLEPGAFLLLYADGDPAAGPTHLPFALSAAGGELGLFAPDGRGAVLRHGSVLSDWAIARTTDCCAGDGCLEFDFRGTPGVTNEALITTEVQLLDRAGVWRYRDDGGPPDEGWVRPGYDDSAWASGQGPLGYGDAQTTVISYGADPYAKHVTTWFRRSFTLGRVDALEVQVELLRDDGAVVYVNGVEAVRDNLPSGPITADTLATTAVGDAAEVSYYRFTVDPTLFVEGENVIAVEVHQAAVDSSDLSFDLGLVAEVVKSGG